MSDQLTTASRLTEVERLTSALTDQLLDAQVMGRPVPKDQAQALAKAARLLHDHALPWPPMLSQVLHGLADRAEAGNAERQASRTDDVRATVVEGLTRLMSAFRRE